MAQCNVERKILRYYWLMTDKLNPSTKLARMSPPNEPSFTVPNYWNALYGANWA